MDEDSTQSSRSSSQAMDLHDEESKHRESDSQMTLTYGGSDSELNDDDTLRIDDSDDDDNQCFKAEMDKTSGPGGEISNEISSNANRKTLIVSENKDGEVLEQSSIDNEEDVSVSMRNRKKISQLIDSDSEEDAPLRKVSNVIDSDQSDKDLPKEQYTQINATEPKSGMPMNRFKSLIDSDSDEGSKVLKKKVKLKTKKERGQSKRRTKKSDPNNLLASLNLSFSDEDSLPVQSDKGKGSGSNDSGSDSGAETRRHQKRSPKDKPQRMSAKAAMEQMQVIQSESQRMAREAAVSVPYHRPKQHTLQEFLSRRTVFKPCVESNSVDKMAAGRKKAITAIKMTPEQLAAYAKQLEEREKEAVEFFKSEEDENESSDVEMEVAGEETNKDIAKLPVSTEENKPNNMSDPTSSVNDVVENILDVNDAVVESSAPIETELGKNLRVTDSEEGALSASKQIENLPVDLPTPMESEPTSDPTKNTKVIDYDPFLSEPTPSKLAQKKAELLLGGTIKAFPTLKGNVDMVIDLDSGDMGPKTPSGPELLLQRFSKCSGKKSQKASNLNILSTDKGVVELSTVELGLELEERDLNGKEPVPGAAYTKLKQSLWEKMEKARRESILKRLQNTPEAKKIDESEDEENELAGDDVGEDGDEVEAEDSDADEAEEKINGTQRCDLLDDEAEVDDDDIEENGVSENQTAAEESNEDDDDDSSEENSEHEATGDEKKKSRIIVAFEDSDEEVPQTKTVVSKAVESTTTEELFSTLEGNDKFTPSDRNNIETGGNMTLLWKDTEEQEADNLRADEDDLLALCSGRFGDTQAPLKPSAAESAMSTTPSQFHLTESDLLTAENDRPVTTDALFTQQKDQQVEDSELIALCSGTFATQGQVSDLETERPVPPEVVAKGKLVIASSDEEDQQQDGKHKKKKIHKRRAVNISDDEESDEESIREEDDEEDEETEEEPERFVDYDSEENEVEVVMTKKDKEKVAKTFVENEAELSESEWGSADEDEKDLDRYDMELGDEENFDQNKLQEELERIHMRRILEQDKKEVKTLQDMFFEDEEKDGVGRERQFKWRNVETTFSLDYDKQGGNEQKEDGEDSDGETEAQWRKMRFEREMLLKEKKIDLDAVDISKSLVNETTEENAENNPGADNQSTLVMRRKITVVRNSETVEISNKPQESCFLIKRSIQSHNTASFLSRDPETLKRLANSVKVNPETESLNTATTGKGRNFVFATVSPAVDKMGSKRSSDAADLNEPSSSAKKVKTLPASAKLDDQSKKRLLLAKLM